MQKPSKCFQADMSFEPPMEGDEVSVNLDRVRTSPNDGNKERNVYLCDASNLDPVSSNLVLFAATVAVAGGTSTDVVCFGIPFCLMFKINYFSLSLSLLFEQDVYDGILKYLQSLGLTGRFADYVIELSRHFEHKEYISFLNDFSDLVEPSK